MSITPNKKLGFKSNIEILKMKEKLVDLIMLFFFVFMWFAAGATIYRAQTLGYNSIIYFQFALVILYAFIFFTRKFLSYQIKSIVILSFPLIIAISGMLNIGLASQTIYFLFLWVVLSGLLLEKKWGYINLVLAVLFISVTGILYNKGILKVKLPNLDFIYSSTNFIMAAVIFSIISLIIVFFWSEIYIYLTKKIETILLHEESLNKLNSLLTKEIEAKKETEVQLKEQVRRTSDINDEYEIVNKELSRLNNDLERSNVLLQEAKEKAEMADRLKSSFLSNMSHEIRTPLNAIVGFSSLLGNPNLKPNDYKKYTDIIHNSTNTLLHTISDIVMIAKIESHQFTLFPETINLAAFGNDLDEKFKQEIFIQHANEVEFKLTTNLKPGQEIITDKDSLKQIINKLMDNAIKFTNKGTISLNIELHDNQLKLSVSDTGIGLSEKESDLIFKSFSQLEDSDTRKYGGVGLGLSITKGLLDLLNGKISFSSQPSKGAFFEVEFPVINRQQKVNGNTEDAGLNLKGNTILVIGKYTWDNPIINQVLQESNAIIEYTAEGQHALQLCKNQPINLVITAMELPDIGTEDLSESIKKINHKIPIVGFVMEPDNINSKLSLNIDGHIESPIVKTKLISTLERFVVKR